MIRLSASLIKDFLSCPKKAYYRINLPGEGLPSSEQLRGTIVHSVLEKAWRNKEEAQKELEYQQKKYDFYLEKATITKCIDNFFEMFPDFFSENDDVEKYFRLPQNGGEFAYTGMIDRVHNNVIFDWKTSSTKPQSIDNDIQFMLYSLAYKQIYGREPSAVVFVSLMHKSLIKYNPKEALIKEFTDKIVPYVLKQIKDNSLPREGLYKYRGCYKCPFQDVCYKELDDGR